MIRYKWKRFWSWLRFGKITSKVTDQINNIPCEIEYYGRGNKLIGFWSYGAWDYEMPYHGEQ